VTESRRWTGGLGLRQQQRGVIWRFSITSSTPRIPQEELESVAGERDVWVSLLDILICQPWIQFITELFTSHPEQNSSEHRDVTGLQLLDLFVNF